MIHLYNIFIQLYSFVANVLSIKNNKARKWVDGRKSIFDKLTEAFDGNTSKVIWVHCASLGEFEQARPVIEQFVTSKEDKNDTKILLTFFSPSGYEIQKNYDKVDWVFYLPIDTKKNAVLFYQIVKPFLIIFVKYEFWYHYFATAKNLKIPLVLVSGIFRNHQPFFRWYGSLHRTMLSCIHHFFLQNQQSKDLLASINISKNVTVSGDTRFDRVLQIASNALSISSIEQFIGNSQVIVAGSTWTEDDEEIDHFANINPSLKFIIAPHEINTERLSECLTLYKNSVLFSNINNIKANTNVIIIDNVGMLSSLYKYATISFVGGGFGGDGVHNVLEPAVYGKPVVFGPVYDKFIEANDLVETGGAIVVESALEFERVMNDLLNDTDYYNSCCRSSKEYVLSKTGATNTIVDYLTQHNLLP
ncbi:MAG: 3-deoxy-D-manno-octulosonic acid transferase [Bacteroidetes bacterium]|nr:3-deoxy-D-manno-octulosonic acid transferase [Bacteroidota bacterium]